MTSHSIGESAEVEFHVNGQELVGVTDVRAIVQLEDGCHLHVILGDEGVVAYVTDSEGEYTATVDVGLTWEDILTI